MDAEPHNHKDDISAIPPPVSMVPGVLSHAFDPNDTPPPRIEGYDVLSYLGEGASGIVWRATQLSTGRQVALKLMGGAVFGTEKAKARFEREVELAARLNHPNIARLYESGIRHGYYYYAMELIEGVPLDQYVRDRHLPQEQIIVLMQKVCNAVQHAHACVVIHRDLKPTNILVSSDGEPHVLDFGLAKAADQRKSNITVTIDGQAAGTVAYMSPEQAAGKLDEIGIGSDIYSLGVILFELLTGDYPHEQSDSIYEQLVRVVRDEPRRPRSLNPALDRDLEAIILKAIAAQSKDRYASASEFVKDLQNYLAGDTVQARPLTLPYFIGKRIRKHRGRVALALAILLLFAATLVIAYVRVSHERDYANQQAAAANQALYFNRLALAASELEKHHVGRVRELLNQCPLSLRDWEWHYLHAASDRSAKTFTTGPGRIRSMMLNQTGDLVYEKDGKQLCVMRLTDGKKLASRDLPHDRVVFPTDGSFAAVLTSKTLRIVDAQTLQDRVKPIDFAHPVAGLAISRDGWIAVGLIPAGLIVLRSDGTLVRDWKESPMPGQLRWLTHHRLAGLTEQGLSVMNCEDGKMEMQKTLPARWNALAESGERNEIVAACQDGRLRGFNCENGDVSWVANLGKTSVAALAVDSSGVWISTGDNDGVINVWDGRTGNHLLELLGHGASINCINFNSQSQEIVSADYDGVIKVWQLDDGQSLVRTIEMPHPITGLAANPVRDEYAVGFDTGEVLLQNAAGRTLWTFSAGTAAVSCLVFDPTGQFLFVGTANGQCSIWDVPTTAAEYRFALPAGGAQLAEFSPNGKWLAVAYGGQNPQIEIFDFHNQRSIFQSAGPAPFTWSSDSSAIYQFALDGQLQELSTKDWQTHDLAIQLPDRRLPYVMAQNGNGQLIVGGWDGQIYRLDYERKKVFPLASPFGDAASLYVSRNNQRLFLAAASVKILDPATGTLVYDLTTNNLQTAGFVALLGGQKQLIAAGASTIQIWNAAGIHDSFPINHH